MFDAVSGEVLHVHDLVHRGRTVSGLVRGAVSIGPLPASMTNPLVIGLRYARIDRLPNFETVFASIAGLFSIEAEVDDMLASEVRGPFFWVQDSHGGTLKVTAPASSTFVQVVHNQDGGEFSSAQVDAYFHANVVRDWALSVEPGFPGLDHAEMPLIVNTAEFCNAFYSSGENLAFARAGAGCENSAFSTIVYHEYGHHLAWAAGGVQGGQYGEGFADAVAMLLLGDPRFALGLEGEPGGPDRVGRGHGRVPV